MAVRDARTLEQLRHEVDLMGPQGRADGWIPLDYETGWEDFGGTWASLGYRRVGDKVHVDAMCKRTSGTSLVIAVLPEGFRPTGLTMRGGVQSNNSFCRVDISHTTGNITMYDATGLFSYVSTAFSFYSPITRR